MRGDGPAVVRLLIHASRAYGVRHRRSTSLAQRQKDLERLPFLVLRDVHEHHTERSLLSDRGAAKEIGTRPLGAALEVLGFHLVKLLLELLDLGFLLGE